MQDWQVESGLVSANLGQAADDILTSCPDPVLLDAACEEASAQLEVRVINGLSLGCIGWSCYTAVCCLGTE